MKRFISLLFTLLIALCIQAYDFKVDGICYNIVSQEEKTASVTSSNPSYSGDIVIPSEVIYNEVSYSVTGISNSAFYNCKNLTGVTIGDNVNLIDHWEFYGCTSLTTVTMGKNVKSIGYCAFGGCSSITEITIGNSVTEIDDRAFWGCSGLVSISVDANNTVFDSRDNCNALINTSTNTLLLGCKNTTIPYGINIIGTNAFRDCKELTEIALPNTIDSIAPNAFADCEDLSNLTLPNSLTIIAHDAFYGCQGLTNLLLPNGLKKIEDSAFSGCTGLNTIVIPASVTSIGETTFSGCTGLKTITVNAGNPVYDSRGNCNAIIETATNTLICGISTTSIPNSMTSIGDYAFSSCTNLTNITIPSSVTSIGNYAFQYCSNLTNVTIPNSVTSIGYGAFRACSNLASITLPNNLTRIESSTFYDCQKLTDVNIPASVTYIASSAFYNTPYIKEPNRIYGNIIYVGNIAYKAKDSGITSCTFKNSTTVIAPSAFSFCDYLTSVNIPNSVTNIGESAFYNCSALTSVNIPNSVTSIGEQAFYGCSALTSVTIPSSITKIEHGTFNGCYALTSVVLPNSLTTIENVAFSSCRELTAITIPSSVTSMSPRAFAGCFKLASINVESGNSNYVSEDGIVFSKDKKTLVKFPGGKNVTEYTVPNFVTSIGDLAFGFNTHLNSITIPNTVTSIGAEAFAVCPELKHVNIPNTVIAIKDYTFESCENLTSITIPGSVKEIGNYVFDYCRNLTEIVNFASVPQEVNKNVFQEVPKSAIIHVKEGCKDAYEKAEGWKMFTIVDDAVDNGTDISKYDNILYVEPTEAKVGTQVTLSVKMKNTAKVQTIGVYVKLPEGVSVAKNAKNQYMISLSSERTDADCHQLSRSFVDGIYRVGILGTTGLPFDGNDGEVFTMMLNIPSDMAEGDYDIEMTEMEMTDTNNKSYSVSYYRGILKIEDYVDGDANGDDKVTMADASIVTNYFLGNSTDGIVLKAADVNGDGKVTMADANIITNMFLGNY